MRFIVEPEKCTECGRCTLVCSIEKSGRIHPQKARIQIERRWPDVPKIAVCRFEDCDGHPCVEACPVEAIHVEDGKIFIYEEECTGCTICVESCPYDAIWMNDDTDKAVKCDLCGGNPACVPECVTHALKYLGAGRQQVGCSPMRPKE
jgi:anaerobic carbon-monoxide dehydrogenase iron sulfur subunit